MARGSAELLDFVEAKRISKIERQNQAFRLFKIENLFFAGKEYGRKIVSCEAPTKKSGKPVPLFLKL